MRISALRLDLGPDNADRRFLRACPRHRIPIEQSEPGNLLHMVRNIIETQLARPLRESLRDQELLFGAAC